MFELIHQIVLFFKEKKIIKSINIINRKLKTHFSYYYVLEEIDFLYGIEREREGTTLKRFEHLNNVSLLWTKGIKEEFLYNYKNNKAKYHSSEEISILFDAFKERLINFLQCKKLLSNTLSNKVSIDEKDIYLKFYSKYDLADLENLSSLVLNGLIKIKELKENFNYYKDKYLLKFKCNKKNIQNLIVGYIKNKLGEVEKNDSNLIYFGPSSYNFNNKYILIKDKKLRKIYDKRIILNYRKQNVFFFNKSKKERIKVFNNNISLYRTMQLDACELRLNKYNDVIKNNNFNDYYFDYFLWRLLNDTSYLSLKLNGGIKRLLEDPINEKRKGINRGQRVGIVEALQNVDDFDMLIDNTKDSKEVEVKTKTNKAHNLFKEQIIIEELNKEEISRKKY